MGPAAQRQVPTKKSLRIWVRNNGHVMRKDERVTYIYPRTVEAARDPFLNDSGKNKMFFMIAVNLFPESKIIKPDDSDCESETEGQQTSLNDCKRKSKWNTGIQKRSLKRMRSNNNNCSTSSKTVGVKRNKKHKVFKGTSKKIATSKEGLSPGSGQNISLKKTIKLVHQSDSTTYSRTPDDSCSGAQLPANSKKFGGVLNVNARNDSIPSIMNNLQKIIQTCSETGRISFSLPKTPRQSRS